MARLNTVALLGYLSVPAPTASVVLDVDACTRPYTNTTKHTRASVQDTHMPVCVCV